MSETRKLAAILASEVVVGFLGRRGLRLGPVGPAFT
jgi:hypothetical protein